jgi:ankyrin repeat protein
MNGWQPLHEAARAGHIDILKLLLEITDNQDDSPQNNDESTGRRRRRGNQLKVDINARTNEGRGCTALWLAEDNHGEDSDVARLLRDCGGISIGYDDDEDSEEESAEEGSDTED